MSATSITSRGLGRGLRKQQCDVLATADVLGEVLWAEQDACAESYTVEIETGAVSAADMPGTFKEWLGDTCTAT